MIKYKIIFLLAFVLVVCENVFSQTKEVYYDSLQVKPYEFIVNKIKFRLKINDTSENTVVIQKYLSSWMDIDTLDAQNSFEFADVNNDGFIDIGSIDKWQSEVFLYNPLESSFVECGYFSSEIFDTNYPEQIHLINKQKNLYYDFQPDKHDEWASYLFTLQNYKRENIASIDHVHAVPKNNNEKSFITDELPFVITINTVNNDNTRNEIQRINWNKKNDFDYATYWKNNWQKFLPQEK